MTLLEERNEINKEIKAKKKSYRFAIVLGAAYVSLLWLIGFFSMTNEVDQYIGIILGCLLSVFIYYASLPPKYWGIKI